MYQVFDNNKPAQYPDHKVHPSWNRSTFVRLGEARNYAIKWLGVHAPEPEVLKVGTPYDYSGCGDMIVIKLV